MRIQLTNISLLIFAFACRLTISTCLSLYCDINEFSIIHVASIFISLYLLFQKVHADIYVQYREYVKSQRSNKMSIDRKRWSCKFNQELFEKRVTEFVLDSMTPINTVTKASFRRIFEGNNFFVFYTLVTGNTAHSGQYSASLLWQFAFKYLY